MLVLGPNSTCDICLECYTSGANVPHAITCGHVFCQKCLDSLMQHKCPLCRERFSPRDVRKLHVDRDPAAGVTTTPSEPSSESVVVVPPQIDDRSQRLLDDIARIVKEGGKVNEIRRVIEECRAYYKSLPDNQYIPVRVSCLLLHNLLEAQRKLATQAEQLRETTTTRDELRDNLMSELEVARVKYDDLERTSRDEKETALAIEKSLREHYDLMNNFWKSQVESANQECRSLREELDRIRSTGITTAPPPRAIELQYFYKKGPKRSHSGSEGPTLSKVEATKGKVIDGEEYELHLSPLAEVTAPLISTAPSLMALTDDSDPDEIMKAKRAKSPIQEEPEPESEFEDSGNPTATAYPFPAHLQPPMTKVDPIPIPTRTPPSRQSSAMAMSVTADHWPQLQPSGTSCSKPRDDIVMSSRPPSPNRRSSSDRAGMVMPPPRPGSKVQDAHYYSREMVDLNAHNRRDHPISAAAAAAAEMPTGHKDHHHRLVSKLHDLLDSPRPASTLHGHMQQQPHRADFLEHTHLPRPPAGTPASRVATPSRPSSAAQLPGSASTSIAHYTEDLPVGGGGGGVSDRKPLVRASDMAMQLEKERRRLRGDSGTGSLRDTTNVIPSDVYPSSSITRHNSMRGRTSSKVYRAATETFA